MVTSNRNFQCTAFAERFYQLVLIALLIPLILAGCSDNQTGNTDMELDSPLLIHEMSQDERAEFMKKAVNSNKDVLKQLRKATARFHSTVQAERYGYEEASPCVDSGDPNVGAMGYHWVNQDLVDPVFELTKPEAILYERDKNGNLKMIAAEYIVIDVGQEHPHFGDYPFDIGGTPVPVDHYSLHVWLWKDNPNGMFAPYNPNVTCWE